VAHEEKLLPAVALLVTQWTSVMGRWLAMKMKMKTSRPRQVG
jgi:hypothetical protein